MTRSPDRLSDYLGHVLEAIERIERYTSGMNEAAFMRNEMAQDAVIRNFAVIGEASRNIARDYPSFATAHPELPLISAYEMRNALGSRLNQVHQMMVAARATVEWKFRASLS